MSKHHLVVFANYVRGSGMTLVQAIQYVGNNYDDIDDVELINAYEETYAELMQFCNTQDAQ